MADGQVPDDTRPHAAPTIEDLRKRLETLREHDASGVELVDAIVAYALKLQSQPEELTALGQEVLELARKSDYRDGEAWGHGLLGFVAYMHSDHRQALDRLQQAERSSIDTSNERLRAILYSGFAGVYLSMGDFEHAVEYGIRALRLVRVAGNTLDEAWLHHGLSTAYSDLGDIDRALEHARVGHTLFSQRHAESGDSEDLIGIARCLSAEGSAMQAQGNREEAKPIHTEALDIYRSAENELGEARALNDLGMIAVDEGDYELAERLHRESLAIREKINNRQSQSTSLLNLGRVFIATGRPAEALDCLNEALIRAEESVARVRIYQIFEALADAYEALGDAPEALRYYRRFHQLRDKVVGESVSARIKNLHISYEMESAEREAEIIREKNKELSETNEQLNRLLDELQRAQDRLVQAEKMASLGQLTAGIAHEIKNPLNFVTNFSAMNLELIEELGETVASVDSGEMQPQELVDLMADIAENGRRILEHSQRADSIIRGMLLHARGGGGEIEAVEFNRFVDEYLKLAFHGFRAQHPDFNVTMTTDFDKAVGLLELNPGDLGRVVLNVATNAFFALDEMRRSGTDGFQPTVKVSTKATDGRVELRIRDNGPGIPDDHKSRIFEPFFTTKAAGEGTGLGLSLSYDIVVQGHGGDMYVESEPGSYSEFVISLPILANSGERS